LAGRVLLKIVYVLTCRTLGLVVVLFRGDRQHTRGSALLGWVGRDAAFLAAQIATGEQINSRRTSTKPRCAPTA
jgi:hypothetical protein